MVQAGDVIGFMGRTGYSDRENVNNIETVHLHFGLELVFDESQKECNSEIWINVYDIVPAAVRSQEQHSADRKRLGQGISLTGFGLGRISQGAAIKNGMQRVLHPCIF